MTAFLTALFLALMLPSRGQEKGVDVSLREELKASAPQEVEAPTSRTYGEREILKALAREPVTTAPVSPYYLVGPQDELIINLWGKKTQTFNPVVDENGFVKLKVDETDIRFSVNGIYFKDLKDKVIRELARLTADIDPEHPESSPILVDVSLGKIRGINIMVLGEVKAPGQYTLKTTVGSVFNALATAGGINPTASLRSIMVRRPGGDTDSIDIYGFDLYRLLTTGTLNEQVFHLHEGDIVVVPPKQRVVAIEGDVKRPGAYEILEGETLERLVELAGGFSAQADVDKINVMRVKGEGETRFSAVSQAEAKTYELVDDDRITVTAKPETRRLNIVEIKGDGVQQPGMYEYSKGMTLADLIEESHGFYEDAMLEDTVLVRTKEDYSLEFSTLDLKQDDASKVKLEPMDKLIVYSRFLKAGGDKYVTISGHVKEPGQYVLSTRMTLSDLVFMAGGFSDSDYLSETWLERADLIRLDSVSQHKKIVPVNLAALLEGDPKENMPLRSKDHLRVYSFSEMQDRRYVSIGGEVRRPGEYELTSGMALSDLVSMASGLTEYADRGRIEIARFPAPDAAEAEAAESIIVSLEPGDEGRAIELEPNDEVVVRRKAEARDKPSVTVSGQVAYPGDYVLLSRTETLSDLVERAGGLIEGAFPEAARLCRARDDAAKANELEALHCKEGAKMRVVIDLPSAIRRPHGSRDLALRGGDELYIPVQNSVVEVRGAVLLPQAMQYRKGASIKRYIENAGGMTRDADRRHTVLIYPSGLVRKARRWFFFSPRVQPGSTVLVPFRPVAGEESGADDGEQGASAAGAGGVGEEMAAGRQETFVPSASRTNRQTSADYLKRITVK